MKTPLVSLKKMTIALFALRFVLLTVILVFTVFCAKSQTKITTGTIDQKTIKSEAECVKHTGIIQANNTIFQMNK